MVFWQKKQPILVLIHRNVDEEVVKNQEAKSMPANIEPSELQTILQHRANAFSEAGILEIKM